VPTPGTPLFRTEPEQDLYAARYAVDGFIRPHGLPHLWASAAMDAAQPEWLRLDFAQAETLTRVELVFNSDLNRLRTDFNAIPPELVRDYDVMALTGDTEQRIVSCRGNTQRFRRHDVRPVKADGLRVQIYATWGSPHAEVFDCRVYGERREGPR